MADNNGTDLNLHEECSPTNTKVEEFDEEIIKTEPEVSGGSWVYQNVDSHELLTYENQNLETPGEQLLNETVGIKEEAFEDGSKIWEKINNLSTNGQKTNENELDFDNANMEFNGEEKVSQDLIENLKINKKEEKGKVSTGMLKKRVLVSQKKCERATVLNHANGKKETSEHNYYNATEKKYKCNECSYAAEQKRYLLYHIKSRHASEKSFKCNECSFATVNNYRLLAHLKSRHMEKPFKCNDCSYSAAHKNNLLYHIKSHHTMEKPYKCKECYFAAVHKHTILLHVNYCHTVEKPYKCNECSYSTVQEGELLLHIKSRHTLEKTFKCNECSYTTDQESDLLHHVKSLHFVEKPYNCNECSYSTVRKSHLLHHVRSCHILEKPFKCNECSYSTLQKCKLLNHTKSRHTLEEPKGGIPLKEHINNMWHATMTRAT